MSYEKPAEPRCLLVNVTFKIMEVVEFAIAHELQMKCLVKMAIVNLKDLPTVSTYEKCFS